MAAPRAGTQSATLAVDRAIAELGPERVIEILAPFVSPERQARIDSVLEDRLSSLTVAVENLYDPHNGAAALRSVEAFGLSDMHAIEADYPFDFSSGVTIGCEQWIDLHRHADLDSCVAALREQGMVLTATRPDASLTLDDLDPGVPRCLIFGNERDGLSPRATEMCDEIIRIDMFGFTQSFNLSVSVALVLRDLAAARRRALGRRGDLPEARKRSLRARWYSYGIRGAAGIIERAIAG